jgi:hypothetical protein
MQNITPRLQTNISRFEFEKDRKNRAAIQRRTFPLTKSVSRQEAEARRHNTDTVALPPQDKYCQPDNDNPSDTRRWNKQEEISRSQVNQFRIYWSRRRLRVCLGTLLAVDLISTRQMIRPRVRRTTVRNTTRSRAHAVVAIVQGGAGGDARTARIKIMLP